MGLRSCQVQAADFFHAIEIGEGARDAKPAVIAACAEQPPRRQCAIADFARAGRTDLQQSDFVKGKAP